MQRNIIPQEHEDQFEWFISSKENVNLSSYKVDAKTGLPLKYLSDQNEALWKKFHKLYSNGMKRSAFLERLQKGPFVSHNSCINHCLPFAFGECDEEHMSECVECNEIFNLFKELQSLLEDEQQEILKELQEMLKYYLAHLTRKGYLNTLHTVLVYSKNQESNELEIQAFDHWSNDNRQDAWFTTSSFDTVFNLLNPKPKWVIIMSDNRPHYHCSETMALVSKWAE
ncbi:hypothetical protein RclHR1_18380003 [Rhizophagus clarus]|uniref:Uncharacterized protein n=1 Tax=Rhizophagus clarus TaxID=94130 RepID=A0A2Z6QM95_9GLOM|nr:hypothetical protein RclHR1_18380003 [Rhizophagus clarus]